MSEPQEYAENKYLGHRMLFKLENQRSHRRKALITKIIWKKNYKTNALPARSRAIQYVSGTIAEKPNNAKYPTYTVSVPVRRNWRAYVKFVGTLPFPIIDCQNRKGSK